ncbi:MAG: hypothetical protein IAF58_22880, partial [Leptolyngbya sp.]|nr:hypothetical protein [Candidatus Melainabacteria bacterium]
MSKAPIELNRIYPIGCTLNNNNYSVHAIMASTERQTLYRGKDRRTGREVTIKELPSEKLSKDAQVVLFQSEIRALNRVRHPNLIEMLDHFSEK